MKARKDFRICELFVGERFKLDLNDSDIYIIRKTENDEILYNNIMADGFPYFVVKDINRLVYSI